MLKHGTVVPTCLPLVLHRSHACASERFQASGNFRVTVNHKLLDAWLLVLCTACGDPAKPTVLERMNMRLHTTRGAGPAARQRRRPDSRTAPWFGRAMPQSHRPRLGRRLASGHRRNGASGSGGDRRLWASPPAPARSGRAARTARGPRRTRGPCVVRRYAPGRDGGGRRRSPPARQPRERAGSGAGEDSSSPRRDWNRSRLPSARSDSAMRLRALSRMRCESSGSRPKAMFVGW